jgi:glutamyl-tRNA synthetase
MSVRLRFAIVPSGHLTLNTARVALAAARQAGATGGHLTLRLDDLASDRCRPAFVAAIRQDLAWLGVTCDAEWVQSDHTPDVQAALAALRQAGRLYPCFETESELKAKAERRRRQGRADVYDRAMLALTPAQRSAAEAGGKRPHWRFRLSDGALRWVDLVLGARQVPLAAISDPVLVRADGQVAPVLASAVADHALGVTQVIRGEENAADTAIYRDLAGFLADPSGRRNDDLATLLSVPSLDGSGEPGRKAGNRSVRTSRDDGVLAPVLAKWLLGPADGAAFALGRLRTIPDPGDLLPLNRRALADAAFQTVAGSLPDGATERFWLAVRGSLDLLSEAGLWWAVVTDGAEQVPRPADDAQMRDALAALPPTPWDHGTWDRWCAAVADPTVPDRLYRHLTGEEAGPPMAALLPLIGMERVRRRLGGD